MIGVTFIIESATLIDIEWMKANVGKYLTDWYFMHEYHSEMMSTTYLWIKSKEKATLVKLRFPI